MSSRPLRGKTSSSPAPRRSSPERSCCFLGEIRAARQHDLQRAKRAHIMAVELWVLLDLAKQLPEINLALARGQMFFVAPVAVGEPDFLATAEPQLVQEAMNPFRDQGRVIDRKGPPEGRR